MSDPISKSTQGDCGQGHVQGDRERSEESLWAECREAGYAITLALTESAGERHGDDNAV